MDFGFKLGQYTRAIADWLSCFPRWPGRPSIVVNADAKTSAAMREVSSSVTRLGAHIIRQAKENRGL